MGLEHTSAIGRRVKPLLADAVLLFIICTGFYWKIVLTRQYTYLDSPDLAHQVLPWLQFQAAEWHRGHIPLWDPHLWAGQPLLGQAQPGTAYPLNWILFALPLKNGAIQQVYLHWYLVFVHFMAAFFAYLLCRDLQRSRGASLLAAVVFSLGGWFAQNEWPQMINGAAWAPLVFLFLLRSLRGNRPLAAASVAGACFGMAWLGGHHQIPLFIGLAAGGVLLFHIFRGGRLDKRAVVLALVFLCFTVLVSGLQTVPSYEYGKLAKRWVSAQEPKAWNEPVPYTVHSEYSLQGSSLLGLFIPGLSRHVNAFAGILALALALLAAARGWRDETVRLMSALAAGGLLLSLGKNNVFHGTLYSVVPMVEKARTPAFAIFIYHFAIAVLLAYGVDSLRNSEDKSPWPRRASLSLAIFGVVVFLTGFVLTEAQRAPGDDRYLVIALMSLLGAALLRGWYSGRLTSRTAVTLATVLTLIELGNVAGYYWPNIEETNRESYLRKVGQDTDLADFIRSIPGAVRCEIPNEEIRYNFGDWYGIDQFGGYTASLPVNLLRIPWAEPRGKQLFGVNCIVARTPPAPDQKELFRSARGLAVYWNAEALPRAWSVHEARRIAAVYEIDRAFQDQTLDLRRATFLLGETPALETCPEEDDVRLVGRTSGRVTIEANMGCRGMVVLGDSYFPGWRATVDGRPARIWEAYTAVRGVVVEKGLHKIEMRYLPASVFLGLGMTVTGLLGAAILSWRSGRKVR